MKLKDLWELLSPLTALIFAIIAIVNVTTTNYIFSQQQYIGLTLLFVSVLLFFTNRNGFRIIYLVFLVLGVTNIIGITTSITTYGILGIGIQPLFILLILIFMPSLGQIQNLGIIENFLPKKSKKEKPKNIDFFYQKFSSIDSEILRKRLNEKLSDDARTAIKKILNER